MGLATIDPHNRKVQTKVYKIPKFGVNRPKCKQDTAVWKCQNLQRNFFVNFDFFWIAVSQSKLAWLTPNLGILWISVCSFWLCGSIVANPIIYRLEPSPSRFETRQWPPCCATPPSCMPVSSTASHDNHEKINSWVSFTFYGYRAPLGGLRPTELRYY